MSFKESAALAQKCKERAEINTIEYKRNPVAGSNFIINSPAKTRIRLWKTEVAKVESHFSKRHNQVTLSVLEDKRTLKGKRNLQLYIESYLIAYRNNRNSATLTKVAKEILEGMRNCARRLNPIVIPGSNRNPKINLSLSLPKIKEFVKENYKVQLGVTYLHFVADYAITVPKTENHLLIGIDEVAHFICGLPEKPENVRHAHEILRPKGIAADCKRQGEFFFKPCTRAELRDIKDALNNGKFPRDRTLEYLSSHRSPCALKLDKTMYANVLVYDNRNGRHEPIVLEGWHKVVRNNEIVVESLAPERMYWD